jgi:4-hydroxy-tetrahydrodipicolinate reductase
MGRVATAAIESADGIAYAGGFARVPDPDRRIVDDLHALISEHKPDVLLDLTTQPSSFDISIEVLCHGVRPVVGASGWTDEQKKTLDAMARERKLGALIVPNFSLGALLMMHFAEEAAKFFPSVTIVEMHHDRKKDAPSGTARATAERIRKGRRMPTVPIHSVRLQGLVAHQEVLFGSEGEVLTIRHDSLSRESFVPGMLAAVRHVMTVKGLAVGLPLEALSPSNSG